MTKLIENVKSEAAVNQSFATSSSSCKQYLTFSIQGWSLAFSSCQEGAQSVAGPRTRFTTTMSWGCGWSTEVSFCYLSRSRHFFVRKRRQHPLGFQPNRRRAIHYSKVMSWSFSLRQAVLRKLLAPYPRWSHHLSLPSKAPSLASDSCEYEACWKSCFVADACQ